MKEPKKKIGLNAGGVNDIRAQGVNLDDVLTSLLKAKFYLASSQLVNGEIGNANKVKKVRRDIARILTVKTEFLKQKNAN